MRAIHQATTNNLAIKKLLDECDCERHEKYRDLADEDDPEDLQIMWESLLGNSTRPVDMVRATCCPPVEQPMLCHEVGKRPPPWFIPCGPVRIRVGGASIS
jgi:hypothetical protein